VRFDELPSYPVRSYTYRNEQVRADEVQRVMAYNTFPQTHTRNHSHRFSLTHMTLKPFQIKSNVACVCGKHSDSLALIHLFFEPSPIDFNDARVSETYTDSFSVKYVLLELIQMGVL
jgi:hypothetical protein